MKHNYIIVTQNETIDTTRGQTSDSLDRALLLLLSEILPPSTIPIVCPNIPLVASNLVRILSPSAIILSGGNNLFDSYYRDLTESVLVQYAHHANIATLGICRGMQFINTFYGGRCLVVSPHTHVKASHLLTGPIPTHYGIHSVNSYHNYGITSSTLSPLFDSLAMCATDGTVEACKHKSKPIYGIMWHPERKLSASSCNNILLKDIILGLSAL